MKYRKEIDGLRALAVLPVILFHAGFTTFSGGFVGVDIFLVISGYLITTIIVAEMEQGSFSLLNFYERRARRILPALFFLLIICTGIAWIWLLPNDMQRFSESLVATSLFSSNILFYKTCGYFCGVELSPLLHTWSLAVEEQFYIIFPIFLALAWRLGKTKLLLLLSLTCILSLYLATYYSISNSKFNFLMLPTRFWELLVGAMAAIYLNNFHHDFFSKKIRETLSFLGCSLIFFSLFWFDKTTPHPSLYTLIPTIGALLIILYGFNDTLTGKILSTRIIVGIGLISYSTYLWHQPLFAFARHRSIEEPSKNLFISLGLLALIFGYLSWKFVEKPFRNKVNFNRNQIFSFSLIGILIFLVFGLVGHYNQGYPSRFTPELMKTHITRLHETLVKNAGCKLNNGKFNISSCLKGNKDIRPNYAVIGDSHGAAITHELDESFKKSNLSFIPYVRPGCPLNFYMEDSIAGDDQKCVLYQRAIQKEVVANNNIQTYILISKRDDPTLDKQNLNEKSIIGFESNINSIKEILTLGKRVILIYPTPVQEKMVSDYMSKNLLFNNGRLEMIKTDSNKFHSRIKYFYDRYDSIGINTNLIRIRADLIFCDSFEKLKCVSQINGVPLYYDSSHLSNDGARLVVNEIMKYIN